MPRFVFEFLISIVILIPYIFFMYMVKKRIMLRFEKKFGFNVITGHQFLKKFPESKMIFHGKSFGNAWIPDKGVWTVEEASIARKASIQYRIFEMLTFVSVLIVWLMILN